MTETAWPLTGELECIRCRTKFEEENLFTVLDKETNDWIGSICITCYGEIINQAKE